MTPNQLSRLGMALNVARLEADLGREEAAELLEVSESHLGNIETANSKPSLPLLFRMIEVYDTSLASVTDQAGI